ncbi:MAG: ribonuclease HII [Bacteroidia bacterium]
MLKSYFKRGVLESGCDEAGRGCLAGPVYAAAVILDPKKKINGLNDSKKLTKAKREALRLEIEEKALAWAVGSCTEQEIDEINILNASFKAMHRALDQLQHKPEHLLIDGNGFHNWQDVPFETIVQGDGLYNSIAAASVLAKTYRDEFMCNMAQEYPQFGFERHKGYATKQHIQAIKKYGFSPIHRKSFHLKQLQYELF